MLLLPLKAIVQGLILSCKLAFIQLLPTIALVIAVCVIVGDLVDALLRLLLKLESFLRSLLGAITQARTL
ncbi:hypothetical protein D3C81_2109540 [compost metagenome]